MDFRIATRYIPHDRKKTGRRLRSNRNIAKREGREKDGRLGEEHDFGVFCVWVGSQAYWAFRGRLTANRNISTIKTNRRQMQKSECIVQSTETNADGR